MDNSWLINGNSCLSRINKSKNYFCLSTAAFTRCCNLFATAKLSIKKRCMKQRHAPL